jgi:hypothetical protein
MIEVPGPLTTAAPLVVRRTVLWPLRRCALRVRNRGAQADASPAVRAHASMVKMKREAGGQKFRVNFRSAGFLAQPRPPGR